MPNPAWDDVYRPPTEAADDLGRPRYETSGGIWREGGLVVLDKNAHAFPDRCVVCNAPAEGYRLKRTLYWHPGWVYFLILVSILIYAIIALIIRKSARVEFGLCPKHRQRRVLGLTLGIGGFLACFAGLFWAASEGSQYFLFPLLGLIAFPLVGLIMAMTLRPKFIDDRIVRLVAGEPFLASLPEAGG